MDEKTFIADPNDYADEIGAYMDFMNLTREKECAA